MTFISAVHFVLLAPLGQFSGSSKTAFTKVGGELQLRLCLCRVVGTHGKLWHLFSMKLSLLFHLLLQKQEQREFFEGHTGPLENYTHVCSHFAFSHLDVFIQHT